MNALLLLLHVAWIVVTQKEVMSVCVPLATTLTKADPLVLVSYTLISFTSAFSWNLENIEKGVTTW